VGRAHLDCALCGAVSDAGLLAMQTSTDDIELELLRDGRTDEDMCEWAMWMTIAYGPVSSWTISLDKLILRFPQSQEQAVAEVHR